MQNIFRKDRKQWTANEVERVSYFFKCNQFFSKIYEDQYFEDLVELAYYSKININSPLLLIDNRRAVAVILLKGSIAIHKRDFGVIEYKKESKGKKEGLGQEYKKIAECIRESETIIQPLDCKVTCLHDEEAELLFVLYSQFNKFAEKCKNEKNQIYFTLLSNVFKKAESRSIMNLASSGCEIKELTINSNIYEQGDKPETVFLILEGSAKVERPSLNFTSSNMVVISTGSLLGEKDINFSERESSASCCSAFLRLLEIPKEAFLKFARYSLPELEIYEPKFYFSSRKSKSKEKDYSKEKDEKLPFILRIKSSKKSPEEQEREYKLIRNSHVLLDSRKPKNERIRSMSRNSTVDAPRDILEEKIKFYHKLRPFDRPLDLTNRII